MDNNEGLRKHLSPLGAWAFAIGTSVGWGSLVVTANTYLAQAGPLGSVLGLVLGALIMALIARNYGYMMRCYPEAGGAYAYTREVFGYDAGFLTAWFLAMTYFAILWANATSLPLFARIFLGGTFRFGKLYTLFGYDVYIGEALLSAAAIALFGYLCARQRRVANWLMIALALLFTAGIAACFAGALLGKGFTVQPAYIPDASALSQVVKIAVISPWAFIGFESISHGTEEFRFEHEKIRRVLLVAVVSTLALYVFVTLLSVTAYPPQYDSWLAYIRDLDNLEGIQALPAFYAASHYLGGFGVTLLMLSLLALVITSLIGNTTALSRLIYSMAKDEILPERFGRVNAGGVPENAVWLVAAVSAAVPLVGRTAIGWIVDVTTIGATLIYGFVSACAMKRARGLGDRREFWTGCVGLGVMLAFGAYILLPNLIARGSIARETYLLFIVWSVLGFLFFRNILHRDRERRFGATIIVWVALLALVLFVALIWMRQSMIATNDEMLSNIQGYYERLDDPSGERMDDEHFIEEEVARAQGDDTRTMLMAVGMFGFALAIMLTNHSYMNKRSRESEMLANIDPMTGVKSKHAYLVNERAVDAAIASGRAGEFAVVVCDVNGLKKINDTLGHKAGDEYIREACKMVCVVFKHSPVYRVGGDEFVVVLTGRDHASRKDLMHQLHNQSVEHINQGGAVVSAGLSDFRPGEDHTYHDVFERADQLMYEEKQLLKGLGAVTRDDSEEETQLKAAVNSEPEILDVKKQLLIVEDELVNQMLLSNALQGDYELLHAMDGVEALEQVRAHRQDLGMVLLDLQMPRMDGMEVLRAMKGDPELSRIPVVVMTADQSAEVECLKLGAMDFIPKPYPDWEIVQARVNRCIELSENRNIIQSTERDALTRLFNIDYFLRYVRIYDQHYEDMPMDAIVVDINGFHILNERYGKQYGDNVLKRLGERIRQIAREVGGVGCRSGADTFLIYCPHREDYQALLNRASEGLTEEETSGNRIRLRMGVYAEVDKALDIDRRFDYAKVASNTVKNGYRGAVGVYDTEMHEREVYKARLLEDFRPSLADNRFKVYYQPKFDIRPDKPVLASAEALVRWDHPELGMISPGVFIPLLEDNGLILELDEFVWRQAAAQVRRWKDRFGYAVPVSVNVSRIDMLTPNLKSIFTDILQTCRLEADDLMLEITESAYTGDSEQVISTARELRGMGMGFRIEMDDFGTGYSSLGLLSHLPIDALKLDMSFIRSAFGETRDVRMIELIIDIADYLGVPVVAEGVETEEQYLVLKTMGCDLVQGYYFSKPVPPEAFDPFLIERGSEPAPLPPEVKKTCMSISKALTSDFESIYYVDLVTDFYLEFYTGQNGDLEIRPGGSDFFGEAREKLLRDVCEADREQLREALSKEGLSRWLGLEESAVLRFGRKAGGEVRPYQLQTIKTRASDDQHIVVGVRPEG